MPGSQDLGFGVSGGEANLRVLDYQNWVSRRPCVDGIKTCCFVGFRLHFLKISTL